MLVVVAGAAGLIKALLLLMMMHAWSGGQAGEAAATGGCHRLQIPITGGIGMSACSGMLSACSGMSACQAQLPPKHASDILHGGGAA